MNRESYRKVITIHRLTSDDGTRSLKLSDKFHSKRDENDIKSIREDNLVSMAIIPLRLLLLLLSLFSHRVQHRVGATNLAKNEENR